MSILNTDTIKGFKIYLQEKEKTAATVEKYMRDITAFAQWLNGREIEKTLLLEYKATLLKRLSARSVNSVISSINSLLEYLGCDIRVKTLKIQRRMFIDKTRELTRAEYERLLNAARAEGNERLRLLIQTICATGIRVSELEHITVEAANNGRAEIYCKGKLRIILLPRELCKMLKEYTNERKIKSGSVFVTKTGHPLDRSNIWSDMKKLCKKARGDDSKVFPHNLRHLFARTFYSKKRDIVRLADILGHSSVNTTRIYTMESGDEHRKLLECLDLLIC